MIIIYNIVKFTAYGKLQHTKFMYVTYHNLLSENLSRSWMQACMF